MKYKAVIFDLFGTLVDGYDLVGYHSALRETSSILKIQHEDFLRLWKDTSDKRTNGTFKNVEENLVYICKELNIPVKQFDINLAKMVRQDYITQGLTPRRYTIETLSQLKTDGYKIGLISNCSPETPAIWPVTPFAPFFDATIFSSKAGLLKPDPRIYLLAAEQLAVKPEECLYVDDNTVNLTAAADTGMTSVLIKGEEDGDTPYRSDMVKPAEPETKWDGPVISALPEVLDILEEAK
jgi:putative hydrolase of the HAD superfamily